MAIREEATAELVDLERRTVSPRVFTDPEVYRAEQERIFARCWLYVAHESQIPQPGDFVTNYMGEEPVIVCRDADGRVRVFLNSCRHRGMRVCRMDAGNTRMFHCPYHGWTYNEGEPPSWVHEQGKHTSKDCGTAAIFMSTAS
jgi:phenylpropionate dioxygenase-like ring-hydroxylating dioxygenase large terminal subunit